MEGYPVIIYFTKMLSHVWNPLKKETVKLIQRDVLKGHFEMCFIAQFLKVIPNFKNTGAHSLRVFAPWPVKALLIRPGEEGLESLPRATTGVATPESLMVQTDTLR